MNFIIEVSGVNKKYDNKIVLNNISFLVSRGEFISILGPSGSGKTTLLSIIAGLEKPDAGRIAILGKDLSQLSNEELGRLRNKHIGFVFQNYNLIPFLSVVENIIIPQVISGINVDIAVNKAVDLLRKVGLEDKADSFPRQLSSGEQQRVAFCRAIINDPDIILADEPTANLDEENAKIIFNLLRSSSLRNKSVILATHDFNLARETDKIYRLVDGGLVRYDV